MQAYIHARSIFSYIAGRNWQPVQNQNINKLSFYLDTKSFFQSLISNYKRIHIKQGKITISLKYFNFSFKKPFLKHPENITINKNKLTIKIQDPEQHGIDNRFKKIHYWYVSICVYKF